MIKNFSDFAKEKPFVGSKIRIAEVLDKPIVLKEFRITPSKYTVGECVEMQINYQGQDRVIFTGSVALINQCRKYEKHLPFNTTIVRNNKYFTFS